MVDDCGKRDWCGEQHRIAESACAERWKGNTLDLVLLRQIKSIAFPSLSTGAFGYPVTLAAPIALATVIDHIKKPTSLQQVMFVLFDGKTYAAYEQALTKLLAR